MNSSIHRSSSSHNNRSNVVERVAEALKQQQPNSIIIIPQEVIDAASEKYRLLSIQVRVGSIQLQPSSQKDTSERRAAALLEYCARQYQRTKDHHHDNHHHLHNTGGGDKMPIQQIPWSALAAAVQTKSYKSLQQLQHILINFLQPKSKSSQPSSTIQMMRMRTHDGTSSKNNIESSRSLRQRIHGISYKDGSIISNKKTTTTSTSLQPDNTMTTTTTYTPRILYELVIRLTGFLDDPHGIQIQTYQLLQKIYGYYENDHSNGVERRGHLYDLQRYAAAYEAATLYHIATSTYQQQSNNNSNTNYTNTSESRALDATSKRVKGIRKGSIKGGKDEALNHEDEEIIDIDDNDNDNEEGEEAIYGSKNQNKSSLLRRTLQIDDLMDVSHEYTYLEIMQVLPRVQALAKKLQQQGSDHNTTTTTNNNNNIIITLSKSRKRKSNSSKHPISKVLKDQNQEEDGIHESTTSSMNVQHEGSNNRNNIEPKEYPTQGTDESQQLKEMSYETWKENILSIAIEQAKCTGSSSGGSSSEVLLFEVPTNISNEAAITLSANAILHKYGIVNPFHDS